MSVARLRSILLSIVLATAISSASGIKNDAPTINAVMNVASYADDAVSPGEMIVIFGTNLGPEQLTPLEVGKNGRLVSDLRSVRVFASGIPCPLIYVSKYQLAAMIPYAVEAMETTQIQVMVGDVRSDAWEMPVSHARPGVFTADASGIGQAAMSNSDGSANSSANPAKRGDWVTFYITGEGKIEPAGSDGTIVWNTTSLRHETKVRIGGYEAPLLYAGSAPGNVNGFAQINAIVPEDLPYGGNLPLTVEIGGIVSRPEVTVAVEGPSAPKPAEPHDVAATRADNAIQVSWTNAGPEPTMVRVERSVDGSGFTQIFAMKGNSSSFRDTTLGDGSEFTYRVQAVNEWGISGYSASAMVKWTSPITATPQVLKAKATSSSEVLLTWRNRDDTADQVAIEGRLSSASVFTEIARIPLADSFVVQGLAPNTSYRYRVSALGPSGSSRYSNESEATTTAGTATPPPAPVVSVSVAPASASLKGGEERLFSASVAGTANTSVTWSISPLIGNITSAGLYQAPAIITSAQQVTVTARSTVDPTKLGTAVVTLVPPAVLSLSLSPTSVQLGSSQSQTFQAQITGDANSPLVWELSPLVGSIEPNGTTAVYRAPSVVASSGSVQITARSVDNPDAKASATVTLVPPAPVVQISVSPSSVSLNGGQTRQFSASVTGTSNTAVTWSISPAVGSISGTGLYSAPASVGTAQTVTVTARSIADTSKTASATVNLIPPAPVVEISVSPTSVSLNGGQTRQFAASVTGSANTNVTWAIYPAVGSINSAGLYTAPQTISNPQTVIVTARSVADTSKTASATVDLVPPAPVVQISVSPTSVSLYGGQTRQFAASVTGSTNTSVTWSISPAVGGINSNGLYSAPHSIGSPQTVTVTARSVADTSKAASATVNLVPPQTYSISGRVSGTATVVVTLSGTSTGTTTTNASGDYSFTGLQNGQFVVVPSKSGFSFSPSSELVSVSSASVTGINFTAQAVPHTVTLNWYASPSSNVVGYNLYRSTASGGPYSKINPSPVAGTSYVDANVVFGQTYYYVATSVAADGTESSFSNQASAPMN